MPGEMHIDPTRAKQLTTNLSSIRGKILAAASSRSSRPPVRLVAVSKLKPVNDIYALYQNEQQRHFGENYQQELQEKAALLPRDIKWHFIGALQSNKCKPLAEQIPNLWCVESVDTTKKADQLNIGRANSVANRDQHAPASPQDDTKLRVFVQVNTSGEEAKSGVTPADATALCRHIHESCPHLHLQGLMTIGALAQSRASKDTENQDFATLVETRDRVAAALKIEINSLELSMGMSEDFETAIKAGSDEVRVGSTIFGQRPARNDAKIQE